MRAIAFAEHGGPEALQFADVPAPRVGPRDVLVRVRAAGLNPVDAKVVRGTRSYGGPASGPVVVGRDAAGTVEAVGEDVRRFRRGDDVYFCGAVGRPGTFAERAASDERIVGRKPKSLSFEEAASIPLVALTAWEALLECMGAPEGADVARTLLVLGGAGGVGSMAIQVARRVCGLRVVATASRPESAAFCRERGADVVVDHSRDLAAQLRDAGVSGLDYVLSCAPNPDFRVLGALLHPFGKVCCILPLAGADLSPLFPKRGTVAFENVSARPAFDVEPERQGRILDRVADLLDQRVLLPAVTEVLPWSDFRSAFERIESAHTIGKIVLKVGS